MDQRTLRSVSAVPQPATGLTAWNADATRMPCHMHPRYPHRLSLQNDLACGRYRVGDGLVALSDIRVPTFRVAALTDHVAPWRSVFQLQRLLHAKPDFLLTSGGHNAGVISPPGRTGRRRQLAQSPAGRACIGPDAGCAPPGDCVRHA
jgi:polyhydroxyalkanoate synthase subunit PhaC